jgi:hypothetical protein
MSWKLPTWLRSGQVWLNVITTILAGTAIYFGVKADLSAGSNLEQARQANRIAGDANRIASDAEKVAHESLGRTSPRPAGGILGPGKLTDGLCYRFYGYQRDIPGNPSLFIVVRATDATPLYVTEVLSSDLPSEAESEEIARVYPGATAFVRAVPIGDDARAEESNTYVATLYWATTEQSQRMRELVGKGAQSLPSDVERQNLGQPRIYTHLQHPAIPDFHCSLSNAVPS